MPLWHESGALLIGAGMLTFMEHCVVPALCGTCNEVVTIDLMDPDAACCPVCGGDADRYDDPKLRVDTEGGAEGATITWTLPDGESFCLQTDILYRCPRCKEPTMTFDDVGTFD